jgi:hypothetical protein
MRQPESIRIRWRTSSHSGQTGNCVELAYLNTVIAIRDSKNPESSHLRLSPAEWAALARRIKSGNFDL